MDCGPPTTKKTSAAFSWEGNLTLSANTTSNTTRILLQTFQLSWILTGLSGVWTTTTPSVKTNGTSMVSATWNTSRMNMEASILKSKFSKLISPLPSNLLSNTTESRNLGSTQRRILLLTSRFLTLTTSMSLAETDSSLKSAFATLWLHLVRKNWLIATKRTLPAKTEAASILWGSRKKMPSIDG